MRTRLAAASLLALAGCGGAAQENVRIEACVDSTRAEMIKAGTWSGDHAAELEEMCACIVKRSDEAANAGERERIVAECSKVDAGGATSGTASNAAPSRTFVQPPADTADPPPPVPAERARPRSALASYASPDDYPPSALRGGEQGRVAFELDVGADGRVSRCLVTSSSGSSALDGATCRIMRSRARFTPARDAQGNAAPDRIRGELTWTLPAG